MLPQTIFLEVWLLVNEEIHTLPIIMKLGNLISSSWKCLPSAPRAPHQERRERWGFTWEPFFPLFLNYFELSDATLADISLWIEWTGFLFFGPWAWLMAESHFFFLYSCYRGLLGLTGLGPLANLWTFGFGLLWTEKMGLYKAITTKGSLLCISSHFLHHLCQTRNKDTHTKWVSLCFLAKQCYKEENASDN